jgi:hypothetical protein
MNTLMKKLLILGEVFVNGWEFRTNVKQWFDEGLSNFIKGGYANPRITLNFNPIDDSIWRVIDENLVVGSLQIKNDFPGFKGTEFLNTNIQILTPESLTSKAGIYWSAEFKITEKQDLFISKFEQEIERAWRIYLENEFEKEECERKRKRMLQIGNYLLR